METNTQTTTTPIATPSSGNGKKYIALGALVLVLGGAFLMTRGGSTLKGSFIGGGANCPTIAESDKALATHLLPDSTRKNGYFLSAAHDDGSLLPANAITWESKDLPQGVTLVAGYYDNEMEVKGDITCPFIFHVTVTDVASKDTAQKAYYIDGTGVAKANVAGTDVKGRATLNNATEYSIMKSPSLTTAMTTLSTAKTRISATGVTAADAGRTTTTGETDSRTSTSSTTGATRTATTTSAVDQTKLQKGSKVIYQLYWSLDKTWIVGEIEKVVIDPITYDTTYRMVGMGDSAFKKSEVALYSFHPETVPGAGKTLVGVGTKLIIKYNYISYAGTSEAEYTVATVESVNGDKITVTFSKHLDKSGGMTTGKETFDRTQVWMNAKDANL